MKLTTSPGILLGASIWSYIKGCKACTTFRNTISTRQLKPGFPQGGVLSPKLFNKYTSHILTPLNCTQLIEYADDLQLLQHTPTYIDTDHKSTHTTIHTQHLGLDPVKQPHTRLRQTTRTIFTSDPADYNTRLSLKINNTIYNHSTTHFNWLYTNIQHLHDKTNILPLHTHTWNFTNQTDFTTSHMIPTTLLQSIQHLGKRN